jgi:acetyl esterase
MAFLPAPSLAAAERALALVLSRRPLFCDLLARRHPPEGGRRLDPQCAMVLALDALDPHRAQSIGAPAVARARMKKRMGAIDGAPPPGVTTEERAAEGIPLRVYRGPGPRREASPGIVFFHGGGWVIGDLDTHDTLCRRLAVEVGCPVIAVDYRLAPEHPFPAAVEDAHAAFRWVAAHAAELGLDAARLAVAGDSAGGNLSAVVALRTRGEAHRPALQALFYPGLDLTRAEPSHRALGERYLLSAELIEWFIGHYLGDGDRRRPDVSPRHAPDLEGAPLALVYTAGFDPLRDEGRVYAERLRAAGVSTRYQDFPGLIHGFLQMTAAVGAADLAFAEIAADLRRALGA